MFAYVSLKNNNKKGIFPTVSAKATFPFSKPDVN